MLVLLSLYRTGIIKNRFFILVGSTNIETYRRYRLYFKQVSIRISVSATDFFIGFRVNRTQISQLLLHLLQLSFPYWIESDQTLVTWYAQLNTILKIIDLEVRRGFHWRVYPQEFSIQWKSCYFTMQVETNENIWIKKKVHIWLYLSWEIQRKRWFKHFPGLYLLEFLRRCSGSSFYIRIPISKQHQTSQQYCEKALRNLTTTISLCT